MSAHTHTWQRTAYLLLGLPSDGYADRLITWRCTTCGEPAMAYGDLPLGVPLATPEWWLDYRATTQRTPSRADHTTHRGVPWHGGPKEEG